MPRLTGENTCAACFCQHPKLDHVDFDTELDRGYYAEHTDNPVPLDEMIVCESCLKAAAKLVDMVDRRPFEIGIKDKEIRIDKLERELRQARTFADNLESAFETRPQHGPIKLDHRKLPRQVKETA